MIDGVTAELQLRERMQFASVTVMTKPDPVLFKVLRGVSDANISFADLRRLLFDLGFDERVRGGHHIFSKPGIRDIINLQPRGSKAKPYQVKQVRNLIIEHHLGGEESE